MHLTPQQEDFVRRAWQAALDAHHIWPEMAACEAALESGYGHSQLATQDRNLFGMKQHAHPIFKTVSLPTREILTNEWQTLNQNFVIYPDWAACFEDRMDTLVRLENVYAHYKAAMAAKTGEEYVRAVSRSWSTDPKRADKGARNLQHHLRRLVGGREHRWESKKRIKTHEAIYLWSLGVDHVGLCGVWCCSSRRPSTPISPRIHRMQSRSAECGPW